MTDTNTETDTDSDPDTEVIRTSDDAGEPSAPSGPLDGDAARRVAGAQVAIVATSDAHGDRDVTVLAGPRCFVRVLDAHRLAYPDEGLEPMTASRSNLAEAPGIAMLLVESGDDAGGSGRRGLHLNGTARAVPADELRSRYSDLPADPVPGRATDVWVVVDVGDAYVLDGDDVPPLGGVGGGRPAATAAGGGTSSPRSTPVLVLSALVVALIIALIGSVAVLTGSGSRSSASSGSSGEPAPSGGGASAPAGGNASAPGIPAGPPTLFGRVSQIVNPGRIVADVGGTPVTVDILGVNPRIPACATADATAFARTTLQGQEVTLVPDPTLPPSATAPGVTRAYAVLGSQLSYTDAAINAGWASAAGPSRYLPVYQREQGAAESKGVGMFGPPCRP